MSVVDAILESYNRFLDTERPIPLNERKNITFPEFSEETLKELLTESLTHLAGNQALIELQSPLVIVGDLHGSMWDLLQIFKVFGPPPNNRYLFLGDYVDRGMHSIEVMTLVLAFYCKYPEHIYMLRGNHEFAHINYAYGFRDSIMGKYHHDALWRSFQEVFNWMSLAAIVDRSVFCVHGGLSPLLSDVQALRLIELPVITYNPGSLISDLVWSDPDMGLTGYSANVRGSGRLFGSDVLKAFLSANHLKVLVRAHQCVMHGYLLFSDCMGVTVFSASHYNGACDNRCGVMMLKNDKEVALFSLAYDTEVLPRNSLLLPADGVVGLVKVPRAVSIPDLRRLLDDEKNPRVRKSVSTADFRDED